MARGACNRLALAGVLAISAIACNSFRPLFHETIVEGARFAHYVTFPNFRQQAVKGGSGPLDGLSFRTSAASPDVLLVSACESSHILCSPNVYKVDTSRGYAVSRGTVEEWRDAAAFPAERTLRQSYVSQRSPSEPLAFLPSGNDKLVLFLDVDQASLPRPGIRNLLAGGVNGNYVLTALEGDSRRKLASVAMDCAMPTYDCMRYVTLINSRWLAISLARDFRRVILFDFGGRRGTNSKP